MKKNTVIISLILVLILCITGCGGEKSKEDEALTSKETQEESFIKDAINQGKLALAGQEYDKALASFKLAVDEDSENEEAKEYYDLVSKFIDLQKAINDDNYEKCPDLISALQSNSKIADIQETFDDLKNKYEGKARNFAELEGKVKAIEDEYNSKQYDSAKSDANELLPSLEEFKSLKDRTQAVVTNIDSKIQIAYDEIVSCSSDNCKNVHYRETKKWYPASGYEEKYYMKFSQSSDEGNLICELYYDEDTHNIYKFTQGLVFDIKNNNEIVNNESTEASLYKQTIKEEEQRGKEQEQLDALKYKPKNISEEQAIEIVKKQFYQDIKDNEFYKDKRDDYFKFMVGDCEKIGCYLVEIHSDDTVRPHGDFFVEWDTGKLHYESDIRDDKNFIR